MLYIFYMHYYLLNLIHLLPDFFPPFCIDSRKCMLHFSFAMFDACFWFLLNSSAASSSLYLVNLINQIVIWSLSFPTQDLIKKTGYALSQWVYLGGIKVFADGSLGSNSALLYEVRTEFSKSSIYSFCYSRINIYIWFIPFLVLELSYYSGFAPRNLQYVVFVFKLSFKFGFGPFITFGPLFSKLF